MVGNIGKNRFTKPKEIGIETLNANKEWIRNSRELNSHHKCLK